jgi:hypothetical protein
MKLKIINFFEISVEFSALYAEIVLAPLSRTIFKTGNCFSKERLCDTAFSCFTVALFSQLLFKTLPPPTVLLICCPFTSLLLEDCTVSM